ncbi:hypothetical protein F4809DRAFT_24540 [Biscogniauxia mediterranea]|nr:hypothetical protein F4809DRAFT_24540 [Biscogniauxia mediterranea]
MSNLKPGQPSSFAEEAVKKSSAARWPRPPLSSDHDDGGVSLGLTSLKPKTPAAAPHEEHEYTKLNATSKPFVPAGIVSDAPSSTPMHASPPVGDPLKPHPNPDEGKNGKTESSGGVAFASQDRISDRLMNLYHKQRRNTATASQGYLSGGLPAPAPEPPLTRGIDSIVQLGTNQRDPAQRLPGLPSTRSYGVLPPVADNFHIPDPIISRAAGNGHPAYRSGLPNSASDGNITGPRNIRGGYNGTGAVIPYNAPETLPPKALPPLQLQPETHELKSQRSAMLNALVGETGPSLQDLLNPFFIPFMVIYESAGPAEWGVIRIKNIPFGTTRAEIVALVGRNAKILNDSLEPVHIIMERVSSKTMDAFVEFNTFQDAVEVVEKFQNNAGSGRPARISNRMVEIELSSQAQLMKALVSDFGDRPSPVPLFYFIFYLWCENCVA